MASHILLPDLHSVTFPAIQSRLNKLMQRRAKAATQAEKQAVDKIIWELWGEEWAVMFTDLAGFSRGTEQFGVCHFLQVIHQSLAIFIPIIEDSLGTLLKVEGDSMMVLFRRPERALQCAFDMQHECLDYNRDREDTEKILLSVGLGWGRVLKFGNADVYGQEVNVAAKLGEDHGVSGQANLSHAFHEAVKGTANANFKKLDFRPFGTEDAWSAESTD